MLFIFITWIVIFVALHYFDKDTGVPVRRPHCGSIAGLSRHSPFRFLTDGYETVMPSVSIGKGTGENEADVAPGWPLSSGLAPKPVGGLLRNASGRALTMRCALSGQAAVDLDMSQEL